MLFTIYFLHFQTQQNARRRCISIADEMTISDRSLLDDIYIYLLLYIQFCIKRSKLTICWLWHCHRPPISPISPTPGRTGSLVIRRGNRHTRQEDMRLPQALLPEIEQQGTMDYHHRT